MEISSNDSEGAFNEFIEDQLDDLLDGIISDGQLENLAGRGSDVIVEIDGIEPPRFVHSDPNDGQGQGEGDQGPGSGGGKIRFSLPYHLLMNKLAGRLRLPKLEKRGEGSIHEWSEEFKTFGPVGVIMDRRRTFKQAMKSSIAMGLYDPDQDQYEVLISRKNRRFRQFEMVEKPRYRAVVFYMNDISYSTHGQRIELEKKLTGFIKNWLDFNYGVKNVEHRFFVHDAKAYEVNESDFYHASNAGGTQAAPVFKLVQGIALSEYDPGNTNFYAFYFGDGELFSDEPEVIKEILTKDYLPWFNRVGIVEVIPSTFSNLISKLEEKFNGEGCIRTAKLIDSTGIVPVIKNLFSDQVGGTDA